MKQHKKHKISHSLSIVKHFFPKVAEIVDAVKPLMVAVTKADCDHADVRSHKTCALAVACRRSFKADGVIIGITTAYIIRGLKAVRYRLGNSIGREITSFDRKAGFAAGLYQLCPITPSNRLGMPRSNDPDRRSKNGSRNGGSFKHYTQGVRTVLSRLPEGVLA
jgi:hypothetical protein